jgi:DNA-binding Xre family transcriptional regulator
MFKILKKSFFVQICYFLTLKNIFLDNKICNNRYAKTVGITSLKISILKVG